MENIIRNLKNDFELYKIYLKQNSFEVIFFINSILINILFYYKFNLFLLSTITMVNIFILFNYYINYQLNKI